MALAATGETTVTTRPGFWGEEVAMTKVLAPELLLKIFSYLPHPMDVQRSALVCRRWAQVGSDWSLPQALAKKFELVRAYWISHGKANRQVLCQARDFWDFQEKAFDQFVAMQKHGQDVYYVFKNIPRVYHRNAQTSAIPAGDLQHGSLNSELGITLSSRVTDGVGAVWNGVEGSNFEPESTNPLSLTDSDSTTFAPAGIAAQTSCVEIVFETSSPEGLATRLIKNEDFLVIYSNDRECLTLREFSTGMFFTVLDNPSNSVAVNLVCNEKWLAGIFSYPGFTRLLAMRFTNISAGDYSYQVIEDFYDSLDGSSMVLSHDSTLFVGLDDCIKSYRLDSPGITQSLILSEMDYSLLFSPNPCQGYVAVQVLRKNGFAYKAQVESPLDCNIMSPKINIQGFSDMHIEQVGKIFIISTSQETVIWDLEDSRNLRHLSARCKRVLFTELDGLTFTRGTEDGVVERWDFGRCSRVPAPMETRERKRKRS